MCVHKVTHLRFSILYSGSLYPYVVLTGLKYMHDVNILPSGRHSNIPQSVWLMKDVLCVLPYNVVHVAMISAEMGYIYIMNILSKRKHNATVTPDL